MASRSLNKVLLIGNITRDIELRYTSSGVAVASFGLATNKSWKKPDGQVQELTEFINVVGWDKMADICHKLLAKGMLVYIEGSLTTRSWDDEAGVKRYRTEVRIVDMILLDSKGKHGSASSTGEVVSSDTDEVSNTETVSEPQVVDDVNEDPTSDDGLPF